MFWLLESRKRNALGKGKRMKRLYFGLVLVGQLFLGGGAAWAAEEDAITIIRNENGRPPIIFESGLGDGKATWAAILEKAAGISTVFSYDRPGYSSNRDELSVRSASNTVNYLRTLLRENNLRAPYILVGHSLGGLYMEYFARQFPGEVHSLILLDPRHAEFTDLCLSRLNRSDCELPAELIEQLPAFLKSEYLDSAAAASEVTSSPTFGDLQVDVVTSAEVVPDNKRFNLLWRESHQKFKGLGANVRLHFREKSKHYIHNDDQRFVLELLGLAAGRE